MAHSGSKPVVCILEHIHDDAIHRLAESATVVLPEEGAVDRWVEEADAVIVRARRIPGEAIARAHRLKVIGKHGAGIDNIDAEAAQKAGVEVISTPGLNAESVAELAVALSLGIIRNLHGHSQALKRGQPLSGADRIGYEISELPVGIVGFGTIGRAVARRLKGGFGASISAYDPGVPEEHWPKEIHRFPDVGSLLSASRLVFLHLPLVEATRGLLDEKALASMPKDSFLVNCSRGGIVNEEALAQALRSGHLAGAASDVFETEPPSPENPLLAIESFIATPHIGASTNSGLKLVGESIVDKVVASLERNR